MAQRYTPPPFGSPTLFGITGSADYTPSKQVDNFAGTAGANASALGDPTNVSFVDQLTGIDKFTDVPQLNPIDTNYPTDLQTYQRKYAPGNQYSSQLPAPIYNAMQQLDATRLQRGQAPLSNTQSVAVANAAQTKNAGVESGTTPNPQSGNIFSNAVGDLGSILNSLPQLPGNIIHEAQQIPQAGEAIAKANGDVSKILQAPGIRLIPGTYTASQLLSGNAGELAQHPLFTALDVLPYAEGAAKLAPSVAAANEAAATDAAKLSEQLGVTIPPKEPNPIATALTKRVSPEGGVEPNLLGSGIESAKNVFMQTRPGQIVNEMWGQDARNAMIRYNAGNTQIKLGQVPGEDAQFWQTIKDDNDALDAQFSHIPQDRKSQLIQMAQNPVAEDGSIIQSKLYSPDDIKPPIAIPAATDDPSELAYLYGVKDLTSRGAEWKVANENLVDKDINGISEVYTEPQAAKLTRAENALTTYQRNFQLKQSLTDRIASTLDRENPVDVAGKSGTVNTSSLHDTVDALTPLRADDSLAGYFVRSYNAGNYGEARSLLRQLARTPKWTDIVPEASNAADVLHELDSMQKQLSKVRNVSERGLQSRTNFLAARQEATVPARFTPAIESAFSNKLRDYVTDNFMDDPKVDAYLRNVDEGNYKSLVNNSPMEVSDFYKLRQEVNKTWMDLRDQGMDPIYLHRVSPETASRDIAAPKVLNARLTPASLRERTLDTSPYVDDAHVSITHDALQFIQRAATDQFLNDFGAAYGKRLGDVRENYVELARNAQKLNPSLDVNSFIDRYMAKDGLSTFDPDAYRPWVKKSRASVASNDDLVVPTALKNNLDRIFDPKVSRIVGTLDPVMNLYRTSILALSPRFLAHSLLGGAMMTLGQTGFKGLKFLSEARDMLQEEGAFETRTGLPGHGFIGFPEEMRNWGTELDDTARLAAQHQYSAGRWIAKVFNSDVAEQAKVGVGKITNLSYNLASTAHDMYRAMAYLTGEDSALVKGLSEEEAHAQGIALARKIFNNWDETTPLERSITRSVLPFYGWMKTLLSYVSHYPFDHPVKTSILGSFARNEIADRGTGLPDDMMNMLFLGEPDANGNVTSVNARVLNPLASVANYFTLAGIAAESNPLIQGAAKTMGLDLSNGGADLYPNVTYNPETGRLEASGGNFFTNEATSVLPPLGVLNSVFVDNKQFAKLLQTNPDAARRQILMQLGAPSALPTQVNLPQEYMKAELNRESAVSSAFASAKKSGDYTEFLSDYPEYGPYVQQIQQLQQSGQLDKYVPQLPTTP